MQINGSIPFHIAKAYGAAAPASLRSAPKVAPATPAQPTHQPASVTDVTNISGVKPSNSVNQLIGGNVNQPINFDGASTPAGSPHTLQLYSRAADKIEAAVAVNLGRSLDVKG